MIDVSGLYKAYGPVQALKDVSFRIAPGEIVGLLGHNGAGKSTVIKTLTGYLQPDAGTVQVDGIDVLADPKAVQARIGYLPENAPLYPELTVQRYLQMIARIRLIAPDARLAHISEAVYATGLEDYITRPIGTLSKGLRQRVGLAQAILHRPPLLILDEPTVGLDPTQIVEIRTLVRRLSEHATVLFSTHILPEVEALCDRVLIMLRGELRVDARLAELEQAHGVLLTLDMPVQRAAVTAALRALPGVARVEPFDAPADRLLLRVTADAARDLADLAPAVYRLAAAEGWPLRELRSDSQSLESIFSDLAGVA